MFLLSTRTATKSNIKRAVEFFNQYESNTATRTPTNRKLATGFITTISRILNLENKRRLLEREARRRKKLIYKKRKDKLESLIQDNRYKGHSQKLDRLRYKYKLPSYKYSNRTIIRALKGRNISFFIIALEEEIYISLALQRVEFYKEKLLDKDKSKTRFLDKIYYSQGYKKNRYYILRKRGNQTETIQ